ncbi:MAG: acyltransferase [Lachnospiraceae bacterium]|nr:acyltransferase [Lachnospiraceae bacterium]
MQKKHYHFMDYARLFSCLGVVYIHMCMALISTGIRQSEITQKFYHSKNLNIATFSVGVFFMVSGAGLMLAYGGKDFDLKTYVKKRILRLFIPFYTAYIIAFIYELIFMRSTMAVEFAKPHPLMFLLTLTGFDGYVSIYGVPTFYILGEWFLGAIIMMYILFPLFRAALLRFPKLSFTIATLYFLLITYFYDRLPYSDVVDGYHNAFVKLYEFFLGMFLIKYVKKIKKPVAIAMVTVSALIICFYIFYPAYLNDNELWRISFQNLAFFFFFAGLEGVFEKTEKLNKAVLYCSGYCYEIFLLHHFILFRYTLHQAGKPVSNFDILLIFIVEFLIIIAAAVVLKALCKRIYALITPKPAGSSSSSAPGPSR